MTIEAWPFLVGRNKDLGYQTIVSPQFLSEAGLAELLAETVGGDYSDFGSATYREILGSPVGDMSLVFRVVKAKAQDYDLGGDEVLFDRSGRSIRLIEGFVVRGHTGMLRVSQDALLIAHENVKDVYHDFWQAQTTFQEVASLPFELPASSQEAQWLQLIKEDPFLYPSEPDSSLVEMALKFIVTRNRSGLLIGLLTLLVGVFWGVSSPRVPYITSGSPNTYVYSLANNGNIYIYPTDKSAFFIARYGDFSPSVDPAKFYLGIEVSFQARSDTISVNDTINGKAVTQAHIIEQLKLYDPRRTPLATYTASDYDPNGYYESRWWPVAIALIIAGLLIFCVALIMRRERRKGLIW